MSVNVTVTAVLSLIYTAVSDLVSIFSSFSKGHLEKSYKQTIRNLEETARRQDEMLRTVFQRIPQLNSRHVSVR